MSTVVPFVAPTRSISDIITIVVDGKVWIYCARRSLMWKTVLLENVQWEGGS
jgi:hypothetical protein